LTPTPYRFEAMTIVLNEAFALLCHWLAAGLAVWSRLGESNAVESNTLESTFVTSTYRISYLLANRLSHVSQCFACTCLIGYESYHVEHANAHLSKLARCPVSKQWHASPYGQGLLIGKFWMETACRLCFTAPLMHCADTSHRLQYCMQGM
jgi:hypothetical protein